MSREHPGSGPRARRRARLSIHAGIEKALYRAAIDPGFRRDLLDDRLAALSSRSIVLTRAEESILSCIPDERLALMIDRIRPEKHGKRRFMKAVATAVVTLATGTAGVACEDKGNPDATGDVPVDTPFFDSLGDMPDIPDTLEIDLEDPPDMECEGSGPDVPPDVAPDPPSDDEEVEIEQDSGGDAPGDDTEEG